MFRLFYINERIIWELSKFENYYSQLKQGDDEIGNLKPALSNYVSEEPPAVKDKEPSLDESCSSPKKSRKENSKSRSD